MCLLILLSDVFDNGPGRLLSLIYMNVGLILFMGEKDPIVNIHWIDDVECAFLTSWISDPRG